MTYSHDSDDFPATAPTPAAVIAVGVADVRRDPDASSELVTQALMNAPARRGVVQGEWTQVTLVDYDGWVRSDELEEPIVKGFTKISEQWTTPLDLIAMVNITHTSLYQKASGATILGTVYLSTALPLLDTTRKERVQVALPGERTAWLATSAITIRQQGDPYPRQPISMVTNYARSFLGVPYLWGGTSWEGIDCSGFVQVCYRMGGSILPRDADQQHDALRYDVARDAMQEGDLIFFGSKSITHVGMALNEKEFIHAEGDRFKQVIIHSFAEGDTHFDAHLRDLVWGIKRVVVD